MDYAITDYRGNSCAYYDTNPNNCGSFDDADFTASNACVACGGGCANADNGAVDSSGNSCAWYDVGSRRDDYCDGIFDDDDFTSSVHCCACGGGATRALVVGLIDGGGGGMGGPTPAPVPVPTPVPSPTPVPTPVPCPLVCSDTNGRATDYFGDDCTEYTNANSHLYCGYYDDDDFTSELMCCACGGGLTREDCT